MKRTFICELYVFLKDVFQAVGLTETDCTVLINV